MYRALVSGAVMIQTAAGIEIPFPERIHEKYILKEDYIRFNVSFPKLGRLFLDFLHNLPEPVFLIIEVPLNQKEEAQQQKPGENKTHSAVLYLDGQTREQIIDILKAYGPILFHDGISRFGVASHETGDELFIEKYKVVAICSKNIGRYVFLMHKYRIEKTHCLITPWDTFTPDHPGKCSKVTVNNMDIYGVVDKLKAQGMYRDKIVED
jgi:hypothetical protein